MIVADEEGHEDEEDHHGAEDDDQHDLIGEPTVDLPVGDGDLVPGGLTAVTNRLQADIIGGALGEHFVGNAQRAYVVIIIIVHRVAVHSSVTSICNSKNTHIIIYGQQV